MSGCEARPNIGLDDHSMPLNNYKGQRRGTAIRELSIVLLLTLILGKFDGLIRMTTVRGEGMTILEMRP